MVRKLTRRDVIQSLGVAGVAGLAGCGGDDAEATETDTESGMGTATEEDTEMATATPTPNSATNAFAYTFESGDAVVGSSLNGLEFNYPNDTGALRNVTIDSVTLAGTDVTGDVSGQDVLNDGDTLVVDFGGEYTISAGDELTAQLSNVDIGMGAYEVDVTVNPQSGGTTFFQTY